MKFKVGRNNLAATIYVPYDCANNCPFCTSKTEYKLHRPDRDKVLEALKTLVSNPYIKDIVFTGGEPTADIELLEKMVHIVKSKSNKNVFINTTLPSKNFFRFLELVNSGDVNGVNISRHGTSFEEDCKLFHSIVDDWAIDGLEVPVKINAVITDENNFGNISKIVNRWKDKKNVTVCFRHDFRTTTFENLHAMTGDAVLDYLCDNYTFDNHTFCDVCDTVRFEEKVAYHRGMEHSSFKIGNTVLVNDIIVFPDGFVAYDWDRKPISELDGFQVENKRLRAATHVENKRPRATTQVARENEYPGSTCGVGSCVFSSCGVDNCKSFGSCGYSHC